MIQVYHIILQKILNPPIQAEDRALQVFLGMQGTTLRFYSDYGTRLKDVWLPHKGN